MTSSIDTILTDLNRFQDLQRTSRFQVFIGRDKKLNLRCESVDIPGRKLDTFEHRTYGPIVNYPKQTYFSEITMTFICSSNLDQRSLSGLQEKRYFEDWMQKINPYGLYAQNAEASYAYHNFKYKDTYVEDIEIYCYDTSDVGSFKIILHRSFPTFIGSINMNWASEEVARLQVSFSYDTFSYTRQFLPAQKPETFDLSTQPGGNPFSQRLSDAFQNPLEVVTRLLTGG